MPEHNSDRNYPKFYELIEKRTDGVVPRRKLIRLNGRNFGTEAREKHRVERNSLGSRFKAYVHICRHGENGNNLPCTRELIEEVN